MQKTMRTPRLFSALFLLLIAALALTLAPLPTPAHAQEASSSVTVTSTNADTPARTAVATSEKSEKNAHDGHVVLIMTSGLQWESLDSYNTPRLRQLAVSGAMGNMVPLSMRGPSCPLNSWLTLSAGMKKHNNSFARSDKCDVPPVISGTHLGYYTRVRPIASLDVTLLHQENIEEYGTFSHALAQGKVTSHPIGTGAGYALTTGGDTYPYGWEPAPKDNGKLAERVSAAALNYNLTVVDADIARAIDEDDYPNFPEDDNFDKAREDYREKFYAQQSQINAKRVEAILERIPDGTRVVVVSLLDRKTVRSQITIIGDIGDTSADFEPVVPGLLYSASVRREGALQLTDIDPTILSWFSLARPTEMSGASLIDNTASTSQSCNSEQTCFSERLHTLVDDSSLFTLVRDVRHPFLSIFHYVAVLFLLGTIVLTAKPNWRRALGSRKKLRTFWVWLGYTVSAFPISAIFINLYDWWRTGSPLATYASLAWLCAGTLGLLALLVRRLHRLAPLFVILVPTSIFILVDTINGSPAMADSAIGFNTLAAARFYGIGNEAYALLAASSLFILSFLGVWLSERIQHAGKSAFAGRAIAATVVGIIGLAVVTVDVLPRYGADFGGALSYIPALLVLLILLTETKVSVRKGAIIAGATIIVAVLLAFIDWLRPASARTHLGAFFQSILDGRVFSVVWKKLETNLLLLLSSNYTFIAICGLLLVAIVLLPALTVRKAKSPEDSALTKDATEEKTDKKRAWLWRVTKAKAKLVKEKVFDFHERYWSWLFPDTPEETPLKRWKAVRIVFIVELVVFVLSFALNDSGIVLPAMGILLLLPMFASWIIDELPRANDENSGDTDGMSGDADKPAPAKAEAAVSA